MSKSATAKKNTKAATANAEEPGAVRAIARETPDLRMIEVDELRESPFNHRHNFGDLEELKRSIAEKGVLQPLLVRPRGKKGGVTSFEIVFGARRYRAAKALGIDKIPCTVRVLDDRQAIESQVIENVQRQDVTPLEEAEGYQELIRRGVDVDEIVARTGKGRATVYARLKLLELDGAARKALETGALAATVAGLVAQVPKGKLRNDYFEQVRGTSYDPPYTYREALDLLQREFATALKDAPWKLDDAELVPDCGACSVCPKRTAAQPALFDDPKDKSDRCLDSKCFAAKRTAWGARLQAEAEASGRKVVKVADLERFEVGVVGKFVSVTAKPNADEKNRTWAELVGKKEPERVVIVDEKGRATEAFARAEAVKAIREKYPAIARDERPRSKPSSTGRASASSNKSWEAQLERQRREQEKVARVQRRARRVLTHVAGVVGEAARKLLEKGGKPADLLVRELVALLLVQGSQGEHSAAFFTSLRAHGLRRGIAEDALPAWTAKREHDFPPENVTVDALATVLNHDGSSAAAIALLLELTLPPLMAPRFFTSTASDTKRREALRDQWIDLVHLKRAEVLKAAEAFAAEFEARACKVCRCTEEKACEGGCSWIAVDLCSKCKGKVHASKRGPAPESLEAAALDELEHKLEDTAAELRKGTKSVKVLKVQRGKRAPLASAKKGKARGRRS